MLSKNKFFSVLTIALSLVVFSTFTMAQDSEAAATAPNKAEKRMKGEGRGMGKRGGKGHRMGGRGMWMMKAANLTDAQKEQIRAIREANKPDAAVREEVKTLAAAKRAGTITADQQARLTELKQQRLEKSKLVREQIQAVLTPEQKALIEQKKVEMKQKMQERRQKRQQKVAEPASTQVG